MAGVEGCSDFCMGAVFMSVILHGMLFDVLRPRAAPVKAQRAQSRQRTHRRCSRHNTASHRKCSWSLAGKRAPHSVAAAGFSKGAACRTVKRPAFPTCPGTLGPFSQPGPRRHPRRRGPGSRYQGLFQARVGAPRQLGLDRCARLRGCGFRGSKAVP